MANIDGLFLRGGRWYLRVMIPTDLADAYPGKDGKPRKSGKVVIALGTSDRKEAVVLATIKRAEWLADFQQKEKERNLSPLESVSADLSRKLAEMVHAAVLESDDSLRGDAALWADMARVTRSDHSSLLIAEGATEKRSEGDLSGLDGVQLAELSAFNAQAGGKAALAMAGRNLSAVLPLVKQQAKRLGLDFDPKAPGAREALLQSLSAYRTAHQEKLLRDSGEVVNTPIVALPSSATPALPVKVRTLRDVFDRWKVSGEKERSKDSVESMERALREFEAQHPTCPLESITRDMGHTFRAWLRTSGKASKTARDRLTYIKTLLKFAWQDLEWLPRQPWQGLDIEAVTENPRRPWHKEELEVLFSSPLHTRYELPANKDGGRDAAYWIPLLALFTGARAGELCQLQMKDVQDVGGISALQLTDDGEDQKIKNPKAGKRVIPLHSELIRLGFIDYADRIRKTGSVSLWPSLPLRNGKPSDLFGQWFREHRESLGLPGKGGPSMHYFRHTVRPLMRRAGFSSAVQDRITGHATRGSIGDIVYDHVMMEELQPAVEAIQYPYLRLPRVFKG